MVLTVKNISKKTCLGTQIVAANKFWLRLKGLLGKDKLEKEGGLLLVPCKSVHGMGMAFAVDVIYLDVHNRVVYLTTLKPGTIGPFVKNAYQVLEVPPGTIDDSDTKTGDLLKVQEHKA